MLTLSRGSTVEALESPAPTAAAGVPTEAVLAPFASYGFNCTADVTSARHLCNSNPALGIYWNAGTMGVPHVDIASVQHHDDKPAVGDEARAIMVALIRLICIDQTEAAQSWVAERWASASVPQTTASFGDCRLQYLAEGRVDGPFRNYARSLVIYAVQATPGSIVRSTPAAAPTEGTGATVPPSEPAPSSVPAPAPQLPTAGGGGFARSVAAPADVNLDPLVIAQSAMLAVAMLFLMSFPAQLFNSTYEAHHDEVRGWFGPLARGLRGVGGRLDAFWHSPVGIVAFLLISALLYGLLDPAFGIGPESWVTLLGLASGIVVVTVLFAIPLLVAHRGDEQPSVIEALPGTLLVGAACVLISRLADFQPGYLYGLVIGFAFTRELEPVAKGRWGALTAGLMLVASFVAWLGLGLLRASGAEGFGAGVAETVLAAVLVAGLEGVVFGLLLRFLPGEHVYAWNRIAWVLLAGIGLFAFFHILINPASGYLSDASRTPLITIIGLFLGFGLVSLGFWAWFRFRPGLASRP